MRIIKNPEERKCEILDTAQLLFSTKGYEKTTINDILQQIGIAKGTFYYYFKSKEEVMEAVVMRFVEEGVAKAKLIVKDDRLNVHEKLMSIILVQKPESDTSDHKEKIIDEIHQTNNAQMHQKSMVETLIQLAPVLTEVVQQGIDMGLFKTPYPSESMEFILTNALFIFDDGLFAWEPEVMIQKATAFVYMMELLLGAEKGSFAYVLGLFDQLKDLE